MGDEVGDTVARRRGDYRTWDELSQRERRQGLALLGLIGAVAVAGTFLLVGGGGADAPAGAPLPPTIDVDLAGREAELAAWYDGTESLRTRMSAAVADVRRHIAANDGLSLEPACGVLAQVAQEAVGAGPAPLETADRQWSDGAAAYARAAQACANLFNGTPVPPPTLLAETTSELNAADSHWALLAADLGRSTSPARPSLAQPSGAAAAPAGSPSGAPAS